MPRVIGIDPGTITLDVCGLEDGRVFLDRSFPTSDALADPSVLVGLLESAAPLDLVAGPSGYGLPLIRAQDISDADLQLAYLPDLSRRSAGGAKADGSQPGGILGLRALMRALARSSVAVVLTPGVVHLPTVPAYRKVNRVDMGTADKVCAVALAVFDETQRRACDPREVSFILLELGGAFSAALAVDAGQIVDGLGGTSGPLGLRAAGALDGEVACLAGSVTKQHLFGGGVATIAGAPEADTERLAADTSARARIAWDAYLESAVKAVAGLAVSAPNAADVILSGRVAHIPRVHDELARRISVALPRARIRTLTGFGGTAKQGAQGAAVIADGLAGGRFAPIVDALGIRGASGTVLDHLYVISAADARAQLKLDS
jgi:predicted butyrate kinase (DUF1464 family)